MPTYEYECLKCGNQFELFQGMNEDPIKKCPECRGRVRRLIGTGAGIIFKGSGFYTTDYRSGDYKKESEKENTAKRSESSEKDSSSTKPEKTPQETPGSKNDKNDVGKAKNRNK